MNKYIDSYDPFRQTQLKIFKLIKEHKSPIFAYKTLLSRDILRIIKSHHKLKLDIKDFDRAMLNMVLALVNDDFWEYHNMVRDYFPKNNNPMNPKQLRQYTFLRHLLHRNQLLITYLENNGLLLI